MTTHPPISNATSPFREASQWDSLWERVRSKAGQFLKTAALSTKSAIHMMKLTKRQIEVTMFAAGAKEIGELDASHGKLVEK